MLACGVRWPSLSRNSHTLAPLSAAHSTSSPSRSTTRARRATALAVRIGFAPCVAATGAVRSSPGPSSSRTDPPAPMVTVAVDAGGADLGPAEVAAGATAAAADGRIEVLLYGPAAEIGEVGSGVTVIDAPVSIAKASDPAHAVRSTPDASIVRAAKAVAKGEAQALVSGGSTGSALAAGLFNVRRDRGIYRPALALPLPMLDGPPVLLLDVGANVSCRPGAPGSVRPHGRGVLARGPRLRATAGGAAVQRRGAQQGHAGPRLRARAAGRQRRHRPELHRQHRGQRTSPTGSPTSS